MKGGVTMAKENNQGVFVDAHNDKRGTSQIDFYGSDPSKGPHDSFHINIGNDGKGTIVEKDAYGNKTTTHIDLKK